MQKYSSKVATFKVSPTILSNKQLKFKPAGTSSVVQTKTALKLPNSQEFQRIAKQSFKMAVKS